MMKNRYYVLFLLLCIISCGKVESRDPVNLYQKKIIKNSILKNIELNKIEKERFLKIIETDSMSKYQMTNKGFWFKISKKSNIELKPKSGDEVTFFYNIRDLEGNDIYNDDNLKPIKYIVDKEDILPALRYGIKELNVKESGVFLMPSFLCYGYQGDGEKIVTNQPLILEINLISLNKY